MIIKKHFILLLLSPFLLLSACSNPLGDDKSRVDTNYGPGPTNVPLSASTGFEPVSGSQLGATTASAKHKIDVSVGSSSSEIKLTTTKNKIVYLSVQGQMISK